MSTSALIRAQVEARLAGRVPGAFVQRPPAEMPILATGIASIDAAIGGVPVGGITEVAGLAWCSVGRKSLEAQLLAAGTKEQFCGLIDATDSFDPRSAQSAGVNLKRLLWIRCSGRGLKALEQAFKSADLLLQGATGLGLVIVDLAGISERLARRVPLTTWFRFRSVVEKLSTALVFITPGPGLIIGTCSALALTLSTAEIRWAQAATSGPNHAQLSAAFDFEIQIKARRSSKKPPQATHSFSVQPRWA